MNIQINKKKWFINRVIYCIFMYFIFLAINLLTKTFHPINIFLFALIMVGCFIDFISCDKKFFKGINEFNNGNYEYLIDHEKDMRGMTDLYIKKLGSGMVAISAFNTNQDDLFLKIINKIQIQPKHSKVHEELLKNLKYYHFMFSIIKNDSSAVKSLINEFKSSQMQFSEEIERNIELLYKFYEQNISEEEKILLVKQMDNSRMLNFLEKGNND